MKAVFSSPTIVGGFLVTRNVYFKLWNTNAAMATINVKCFTYKHSATNIYTVQKYRHISRHRVVKHWGQKWKLWLQLYRYSIQSNKNERLENIQRTWRHLYCDMDFFSSCFQCNKKKIAVIKKYLAKGKTTISTLFNKHFRSYFAYFIQFFNWFCDQ